MPLSMTPTNLQKRCLRLAHLIADQLTTQQCDNGDFPQHSFYAKAFALALWQNLDPSRYVSNNIAAITALKTDPQDARYHREFIDYALDHAPDISRQTRAEILRNAPYQSPNVANWRILGLQTRQNGSIWHKWRAKLDWLYIRARFWRAPAFMDRPGCFSAQYHAFCAALLCNSPNPAQRKISAQASNLITQLCTPNGMPNLLGRGAGQSFGTVTALYALLSHGHLRQAETILFYLEQTLLMHGSLPLNLLAPGPLADDPGPANPATPGWYSYNRHYDYLAFAGFWLMRSAMAKPGADAKHQKPAKLPKPLFIKDTTAYSARMCLSGKTGFDITPAPVLVTNGHILLPPTGGEEDFASLYTPKSQPLPAFPDRNTYARFIAGTKTANTVQITFSLAGQTGQRDITFNRDEIIIRDRFNVSDATGLQLFRLLVPNNIMYVHNTATQVEFPGINARFIANYPIKITEKTRFAVTGPVRTFFVTGHATALLRIVWGPK